MFCDDTIKNKVFEWNKQKHKSLDTPHQRTNNPSIPVPTVIDQMPLESPKQDNKLAIVLPCQASCIKGIETSAHQESI